MLADAPPLRGAVIVFSVIVLAKLLITGLSDCVLSDCVLSDCVLRTGLMALPIAATYDILIHLGSRLTPRGLLQSTGDLSGCVKRVVVLAFSSVRLAVYGLVPY